MHIPKKHRNSREIMHAQSLDSDMIGTMNKNNSIIFWQDNVRTSWVSPVVLSEAEPSCKQVLTNKNLWLSVLSPDP